MSSPTFRPTPAAGSGTGDMTKAVYDTDDDGKVDSAKTLDGFDSTDFASRTASDLTLYVYEDATGDADGSSKANGFTTLQAAIDAIPDVAQNVTIIVCKGSTNYLGDTTTIHKASVKLLTIQGEYYWYANCDANAVAGKVVDADIDTTGMEVGDRVVCTKYSGTVGASSIEDYFYATITEVGSGYVQTSEETKVPTTGWQYLINQTCIYSSISASPLVGAFNVIDSMISLRGVYVETQNKTTQRYAASIYKSKMSVTYSIIRTGFGILAGWAPTVFTTGSYIETYNNAFDLLNGATATISNSVINLTNSVSGIGVLVDVKSHATAAYSGFFNANKAAVSECNITLTSCYIDSSCTYGAYGYNITLVSCTNNATTPVYNLTSGGSIEEWDGQALPSIADATGGQVLALKSDKSALEFATVDLDTLGAASSTTATQAIYVDKAATGDGTGVDWTNAFTTIQAAVNSLPAIINNAVNIYVRKGSTPYAESVSVQRVIGAGSITIQGEYYWHGVNTSSKTGKFDVGSSDFGYADRAQIAAGDQVWMTKWSGTVNASTPSESIIDTVASVSGTEVTLTTNTEKALNTTWTYRIVNTAILGAILANCNTTINGISCDGTGGSPGAAIAHVVSGTTVSVAYCYITGSQARGINTGANTMISDCAIKLTGGVGECIHAEGAVFKYGRCVFSGITGIRASGSFAIWNTYNHIMPGTGTGIYIDGNSFVRSYAGRNDATTPTNPASSSESAYILQG